MTLYVFYSKYVYWYVNYLLVWLVVYKKNQRNYVELHTFNINNQWTDKVKACTLQAIRECSQTDCLNYSLIAQVMITVIFAKVKHVPNARLEESFQGNGLVKVWGKFAVEKNVFLSNSVCQIIISPNHATKWFEIKFVKICSSKRRWSRSVNYHHFRERGLKCLNWSQNEQFF